MKTRIKMIFFVVSCLFLATACSGGGGGTATGGSNIAGLPANTDPVSGVAQASLLQKGIQALEAATGLKLSAWSDSSNWQNGNSRAMCEIGQALKESLGEAMNPDKIKCYVGAVHANTKLAEQTVDNGEYFYLKLVNFPENPNMEPRIKMKLQKDASGKINLFEMFSCFDFDGSSYTQSEYTLQQINSDLSITSSSKHMGSEGSASYGGQATVSGQLNGSYEWTSKNMSLARYFNDGSGGSHAQEVSVTQQVSSFLVSGYNAGTFGQDKFSNAFYAAVQGLNMSSPRDIALGDGSASYNLDWCNDTDVDGDCADESGGNRHVNSGIDSWDGDARTNLGTASDGDYHSQVSGATVPSVGSVAAISFSSSEAWDCSADSFYEADMSNMENPNTALGAAFAACDAKFAYQDEHSGYACDAAQ